MSLLPDTVSGLLYLISAACFIFALKGMSRPPTARRGNAIGAAGAVLAVATVLLSTDIGVTKVLLILAALVLGAGISVPIALKVPMTSMPQLVAILNGVGGLGSVLVGVVEISLDHGEASYVARVAVAFAVLVGAVAFTGSLLTYFKLQGIMSARPIVIPLAPAIMVVTLILSAVAAVFVVVTGSLLWALALSVLGMLLGILVLLPIGGADAPVTIALLNAFTGLSVAASGVALDNTVLLISGMLVGCSGLILTLVMADGMGRSVAGILLGSLKGGSTAGSTQESDRPVRRASPDDVAVALAYASKVVVVPGYGLAVAQAQNVLAELVTALRIAGWRSLTASIPSRDACRGT